MKRLSKLLYETIISIVEETHSANQFVRYVRESIEKRGLVKDQNSLDIIVNKLKSDIERSGTNQIYFADFKYPALGFVTYKSVYINETLLITGGHWDLLYTIFHELAHQYQFKKYGEDLEDSIYRDEDNLEIIADNLLKVEYVADEFAARKVREYATAIGETNAKPMFVKPYKSISRSSVIDSVWWVKNLMVKNQDMSKKELTELMYNMIVNKINE